MALTALNAAATSNYVSDKDPGYKKSGKHSEDATVFELGSIDSYIQAHITSKATSYSLPTGMDVENMKDEEIEKAMSVQIDVHTMAREAVKFCLKGWSNFLDHTGTPIKFKTKNIDLGGRQYSTVHPDLLATMPPVLLLELYKEIENLSNLSGAQAKN